jgi:hypothetical protein
MRDFVNSYLLYRMSISVILVFVRNAVVECSVSLECVRKRAVKC